MELIPDNPLKLPLALCLSASLAISLAVSLSSPPLFSASLGPSLQKGLRTLVVACRHFSVEEYAEVDRQLHEARTALQQRDERLAQVFSFIERDLELLGATGVEDK